MRRITRFQDIRVGDVWSVRSKGWLGRAIRFFSKGRWSHSGIVYCEQGGKLYTLEALETIRRQLLLEYRDAFLEGRLAVFRPNVSPKVRDRALALIGTREGGAYGWLSTAFLAVVLPLNRILKRMGIDRQIPNPFRRALKCSELVLEFLVAEHLGQGAFGKTDDLGWTVEVPDRENFTPADLVACCESGRLALPSEG